MKREVISIIVAFFAGVAVTVPAFAPGATLPFILIEALIFVLIAAGWVIFRRRVREQRKLLAAAVETLPIPIAVYDRDERLTVSNSLYRDHHPAAFARREARGEKRPPTYRELLEDGVDPALPPEERRRLIDARLADQPPEDGRLVERSYPGIGWLRQARRRLPGGGSVRIAISVTELKEREAELLCALERARASEEARDKFLDTMTHELRTPLNGVIGMSTVILAADVPDDVRKNVKLIRSSGLHLLTLIDQVLDFTKLSKGAALKSAKPFDVAELIAEVVESARAEAAETDIALVVSPAPPIDATTAISGQEAEGEHARPPSRGKAGPLRKGDSDGLRKIAVNLIGNAVKFADRGKVDIRLDLGDDAMIRLIVSDTGPGIPADKLTVIFEPFEQVDGSMTRQFGGAGLGLSICAEIAKALGGEIEVKSQPGEGSAFTLTLPMAAAAADDDDDADDDDARRRVA